MSGNSGFFKSLGGILKLLELALGIVCLALATHYSVHPRTDVHFLNRPECAMFVTSAITVTATGLIVLSCIVSSSSESQLKKTLFEPLYHGVAAIMYLVSSIVLLVKETDSDIKIIPNIWHERKDGFLAAGGVGIANGIFYAVSTYDSCKGYL